MLADGWRRISLGEFVTLQRGHDLPDKQRRPGSVPILGSFGVTGWHDTAKAPGPGVTVGRSGVSFGVVTYSPVDYWPLNTALYVVDFHGNDERFSYYFLKCFDFQSYNSGSAQPSLNRNFIHPAPVDVPSLPEQRAIVNILGHLDDKIDLNRRIDKALSAIVRAAFKSWFVDFKPLRTETGGGNSGLPQSLAHLFPRSLDNSELGEIPKGWRAGRIADLADISREGIVDPSAFPDELFDHFSIPAFDEGRGPKAEKGITIRSSKFLVAPDSVLLSKLNPRIPRIWLPEVRPSRRAICSTEFLVVLPKADATREFLFCLLDSANFAATFVSLVTGTSGSHQRVRPEGLSGMHVIIPEGHVIREFTRLMQPLLERQSRMVNESHTLSTLRDTLLRELISGRLRVKDAERFLSGAA